MSNPNPQGSSAELEVATPVRLVDLLDYVSGAVVSRTILKRGTSTITLFSFDAGEGLSEHSAPFDAFVTILDGSVELTIGGQSLMAEEGQTVVMPANVPHAVRAVTPFKMLLVMLREAAKERD